MNRYFRRVELSACTSINIVLKWYLKLNSKLTILVSFLIVLFVECGNFLALDLGGTNFRVLRIRLNQQGEVEMENTIYMIPESIMVGHGNQVCQGHHSDSD